MIARLRGEVLERSADRVVVDVAGVGYLVHVPAGTALPARGSPVDLHTSLQVREDSMTLYGFLDAGALVLFETLLGSSGVGPRLALAALSTHPPAVLVAAIGDADLATLTAVPGIGRKLAERIVLDLADRLPILGGSAGTPVRVRGDDERLVAVREALQGFGFSSSEVAGALAALEVVIDDDVPTLLRRALRVLDGVRVGGGGR